MHVGEEDPPLLFHEVGSDFGPKRQQVNVLKPLCCLQDLVTELQVGWAPKTILPEILKQADLICRSTRLGLLLPPLITHPKNNNNSNNNTHKT